MDKNLVESIRKTLTDVEMMLRDINSYLSILREQTEDEIASLEQRKMRTIIATAPDKLPTAEEVRGILRPSGPVAVDTTDPRQPYIAGRQPRRDGDSFGSVQPSPAGGTHETTKDRKQR